MRALLVLVLLAAPAGAAAQNLSGSYSVDTPSGPLVFTLTQGQRGALTGSLSGNGTTLVFQGQAQRGGSLTGTARAGQAALHVAGTLQGAALDVTLSEMDAAGQPIPAQSSRIMMTRIGQTAADTAQRRPGLLGRIGNAFAEAARQQQQQQGAGGAATPGAAPGAAPSGPIATTQQDQQIAQLLTSSRWCYMRYSQAMGSTSTERVSFTADGRFVMATNRESAVNNSAGSYYGNSSGGDRGMWRVQNGVLMMSSNGMQWEQYPLQITRNSNGYPIVTANGKEYSQCN